MSPLVAVQVGQPHPCECLSGLCVRRVHATTALRAAIRITHGLTRRDTNAHARETLSLLLSVTLGRFWRSIFHVHPGVPHAECFSGGQRGCQPRPSNAPSRYLAPPHDSPSYAILLRSTSVRPCLRPGGSFPRSPTRILRARCPREHRRSATRAKLFAARFTTL